MAAGDKLQVTEAVQKSVEFSRHNMVVEPPPLREAHFVFCRNVLIYFSPETAAHVLRGLCEALVPGGYLVLGPVEEAAFHAASCNRMLVHMKSPIGG